MNRTAIWLAAMLGLLAAVAMKAQDTTLGDFKTVYERELRAAGVIGSSFVLVREGKVATDYRYGSANLAKKQAVDENTIYHWASNTKPFTALAIMQLRDRGRLKLDDPVTKYLPELGAVHNAFGSMDEITIRHLMTHSAGFRGGTWPWGIGKDWEPFEPTEYSQLVAMFPYTEIRFKPGSRFSYSNPGIIFLGRIIEKLSGEDYEVYIDKNIFKPLQMHRSYFDTTPSHLINHRSHSYYIENGKRTEGRFDADTGITVSNSGLNSPMADMVKYVNFLIGPAYSPPVLGGVAPASGDGVVGGGRVPYDTILKRSTLEEMWKPQLSATLDANGNKGFTTDIGLIFFLNRENGRTLLGHGGDQNGFISYIDFDPAKRTASILVLNTNVNYPANTPDDANVYGKLRRAIRRLL